MKAALPTLSVIIPAFNEARTLAEVIERVRREKPVIEIIAVDDGSSDGSSDVLEDQCRVAGTPLRIVRHAKNRGKGAAVRSGLVLAQGEVTVIQDADMEYSPQDFSRLLEPFHDPGVQAVYGSRNLRKNPKSSQAFYWGGRLLSWVTNLLYGSAITDEATGYKLIRTSLLRELNLRAEGFEFCPELTGKLLRRGIKIHEVPISYQPRSKAEGKKIKLRDGAIAIWTLIRERVSHT